ncbi:MAG: hypothetical protein R2856_38100 [Caldilineaceae bacterium]
MDRRSARTKGGYLPFEFDVTASIRTGTNEIVVRVTDPDNDSGARWPESALPQCRTANKAGTVPSAGCGRSVWIGRAATHLKTLRVTPNAATGEIAVDAEATVGDSHGGHHRHEPQRHDRGPVVLNGLNGKMVLDNPGDLLCGAFVNPTLYTVTATLRIDSTNVDQLGVVCGFRTVENATWAHLPQQRTSTCVRSLINNTIPKPFTPPSLEFLEDQVRKASPSASTARAHQNRRSRYYEVADRLGILIWTRSPTGYTSPPPPTSASRRPSAAWSPVIGITRPSSPGRWSTRTGERTSAMIPNTCAAGWPTLWKKRQIDPRLIVDNSACGGNGHVMRRHGRLSPLPRHPRSRRRVGRLGARVRATAPTGPGTKTTATTAATTCPCSSANSATGACPTPKTSPKRAKNPGGSRPVTPTAFGIVYPHGMPDRFEHYGLDTVFGTLDNFTAQHQRHMSKSLAYEIATMRRYPRIGGYVITEFTDVHWECNGLLDMQRNVKQNLDSVVALVRPSSSCARSSGAVAPARRSPSRSTPSTSTAQAHPARSTGRPVALSEIAVPGGVVDIPACRHNRRS